MTFRKTLACFLLGMAMFSTLEASAQDSGHAFALQAGTATSAARYQLGAVVDLRQASKKGVTVLAVTPRGAAERMGLRAGDQLRAINGNRLDGTTKPATTFDNALQDSDGNLQIEAVRNGMKLMLSGKADMTAELSPASRQACGYITDQARPTPRDEDIFAADITQIDGRSTPTIPRNRHRVDAGKRVIVVREFIHPSRLNSSQLLQIEKMKKFSFARAYKSLVVDVKPGTSHRIGARLLRDKLDAQSIRENAYWEPVVWAEVPETCP